MEALEARRVLATFFVNTTSDASGGVCVADNASAGSACSIRDAIAAAESNAGSDRIEIPAGTYSLTQGELQADVAGNLQFVGTGSTVADVVIDGNGARAFVVFDTVSGATASFANMTIQNGAAGATIGDDDGGGAILASNDLSLVINNVVFQGNRAENFVSPPFNVPGAGGAIQTGGSLTIVDSVFQNNSAESFGGAIDFNPSSANAILTISSTRFVGNSSGIDGGAIFVDGGAASTEVRLDATSFDQNTSGDSGGAVFLSRVASVDVSDSVFNANVAQGANGSDGVGGGLYIRRTDANSGGVRISEATFSGNRALTAGAGAFIANSSTSISNSTFSSNVVFGNGTTFLTGGGGLSVQSDDLDGANFATSNTTLTLTDIIGNTAPAGGGISVVDATLIISNSEISDNVALESASGGGGIGAVRTVARSAPSQFDVSITNSVIKTNTTAGAGGGIGALDATLTITDSTVDSNQAAQIGGGIGLLGQSFGPQLTVERTTVSNNSTTQNGGGVAVIDAQLTVVNATVSDNSAGNSGGGIAYTNSNTSFSASVSSSTIASNSAGVTGSNVAVASSVMRFLSTIIADPQGAAPAFNFVSFPGTISSQGFNLVSDNSSSFASASDLVNTDPLLGELSDNGGPVHTRALLAGSPAIDAGSGAPVPTDARGLARPFDGDGDGTAQNDIGAFEVQTSSGGVVADDDSVVTDEDTAINIDVTDNDTGGPLTISIDTPPTRGTATVVGNQVRYVPDMDVFGSDSFVYRAENAAGMFDLATVSVIVSSVNDSPRAGDDMFAFTNDQPQTISLSELTANDTGGPGDEAASSISFIRATQPTVGTLTIGTSSLEYTPRAGFVGVDTFTYTIADDGGLTSTATVSISVSDPVTTLPTMVTLSTGSGEGDLTVTVDGYGAFGTSELGGSGAVFDPIGAVSAASTVFRAYNAFRNATSGPNAVLSTSSLAEVPIQANATNATSSFTVGGFQIALTQIVRPRFDAAGLRAGAELVQTYTVRNVSAATDTFDVTRYVDGDLRFDGSLIDGGGILTDADGNLVLFETDIGGNGASDTTFVGIRSNGGIQPTSGHFEIDNFSVLNSDVRSGSILTDSVFGDGDGNGFIDLGAEYDVALALRRLLTIPVGTSGVYETTTLFGQRPDQVLPQNPGGLSGHVFCDANGNGIEDSGEVSVDATVFIDTNGNRLLDPNELNTRTNSLGDYQFPSVPGGTTTVALILLNTCHGLPTHFGTVASSISIGSLPRDLEATDFDGDGDIDLLVASDLSNSLTILGNVNGELSSTQSIALESRPQAIAAVSSSTGPSVVAVAAFGSPSSSTSSSGRQNQGFVYRIQGSQVEAIRMGDGPVDVAIADFNEDGLADIVSAATRSSDFHLLMGGSTTSQIIGALDSAISVTTGDFNADGNQDIAMAGYGRLNLPSRDRLPGRIQVLLGDGQGGFVDAGVTRSFNQPVDLRAAALNSSGGDELIVLGYLGELAVFSLGSSGIVQTANIALEKGVRKIEVGEVNRDGLLDIVVVNPSNESITLMRGDGLGGVIVTKELRSQSSDSNRAPIDVAFGAFRAGAEEEMVVAYAYEQNITSGALSSQSSTALVRLGIGQANVVVSSTSNVTVDFTPTTRLDVDANQEVTAGDALAVILAMSTAEGEQLALRTTEANAADVNLDGYVSAVDALMIINHLHRKDANSPANVMHGFTLPVAQGALDLDDDTRMIELLIEDQLRLRSTF